LAISSRTPCSTNFSLGSVRENIASIW
jgi:hypothetical protein